MTKCANYLNEVFDSYFVATERDGFQKLKLLFYKTYCDNLLSLTLVNCLEQNPGHTQPYQQSWQVQM